MLGTGLPIVLVVISGRPLILDSYLGNANLKAVVAAWLPGTEGQGVAVPDETHIVMAHT